MVTTMSFPISGFTAVPNPMMLSFLATQGFAIMYYGGAGWQFGKRKVSGMSNEQVNNMTPNEFLQQLHGETRTMIPTMQQGMKDMTPLIHTTITQFGSYIQEAIRAIPEAVGNIFQQSYQGADNPYGTLTNVRLSQGSQQYQRDRELYAGGASSLYEQDIIRQNKRTQAELIKSQNARAQEVLDARARNERAEAILKHKPVVPQVSRGKVGKKKAGQSQIMERNKLIKEINNPRSPGSFAGGGGNNRQARAGRKKQAAAQWLRSKQQALVNLLARYRF